MKLNILSDLHLGFGAMDWPVTDADVVVLAGDISRPREAIAWALKLDKPVLYVPGNHEFYGSSIDGALEELRHLSSGTRVQVLDNCEVALGGVRFLGTTLWTDFELFDDAQKCSAAKAEAQRSMRDFSRIRTRETRDSIHPRFAGSLLNAGFVSDAAHLLHSDRVTLWIPSWGLTTSPQACLRRCSDTVKSTVGTPGTALDRVGRLWTPSPRPHCEIGLFWDGRKHHGTILDHSHSIVNRRAPLRGKARRAPASNRLDTDKSTVVFDSPARSSDAAVPGIDGSRQGLESEMGMSCRAMTVSTGRSRERMTVSRSRLTVSPSSLRCALAFRSNHTLGPLGSPAYLLTRSPRRLTAVQGHTDTGRR